MRRITSKTSPEQAAEIKADRKWRRSFYKNGPRLGWYIARVGEERDRYSYTTIYAEARVPENYSIVGSFVETWLSMSQGPTRSYKLSESTELLKCSRCGLPGSDEGKVDKRHRLYGTHYDKRIHKTFGYQREVLCFRCYMKFKRCLKKLDHLDEAAEMVDKCFRQLRRTNQC